jgi:hypothetical protein
MTISNYLEAKVLDAVFNNISLAITTPYISLHTADPGETGASEVTGGSYVRQAGSFASASGGTITSDAAVNFTGMPAVTVTHVGVWDSLIGGANNFLWGGALAASQAVGV